MMIINSYQFAAAQTLLLDSYSAKAAFSLRKLKSSFAGSPIRVRNSSDNSENDVAFVNNAVDSDSLTMLTPENLLGYSEQFDNAVWNKTAGSVSANATTDPLGGSTADQLTHGSAININQVIATTASTTYYFACYLKKSGSVNNCDLYIYAGGFVSQATFNLNNGTIVSQSFGTGATITDAGGGWYECTVNGSHGGTTTSFGVYNSTEVYAWGAHVTTTPRDYIVTTTPINLGGLLIPKWYDQVGALDLVQTTAASQPIAVETGTLITMNSKASIKFNSQYLTNSINISQPTTIFMVVSNNGAAANVNAMDGNTARQAIYSDGSKNVSYYAGTTQSSATAWGTSLKLVTALFNGASSKLRVNKSDVSTANPGSNGLNGLSVGTFSGSYWLGDISELIIFDSDQSSNIIAIENEIATYYGL